MQIICLDYDGTYTALPYLMNMIIEYGERNGIKVILATMRQEEEANFELKCLANQLDVFYTGRKAKKEFLLNLGIKPDIWIDDHPEWISMDSK